MNILKLLIYISSKTYSYPVMQRTLIKYMNTKFQDPEEMLLLYQSLPLLAFKIKTDQFIYVKNDSFNVLNYKDIFNKNAEFYAYQCNKAFEEIEVEEIKFWVYHNISLYKRFNRHRDLSHFLFDDLFSIFILHYKKLSYINLIVLQDFVELMTNDFTKQKKSDDTMSTRLKIMSQAIYVLLKTKNHDLCHTIEALDLF